MVMGTSPYGRNRDSPPFSLWPAPGQTEDVQMLLRFGADPTLVDRQSRSAVDVLKRNKNFRAIDKINTHLEKLAACSKDLSGTASRELTFSRGQNWFCEIRYKSVYLVLVHGDESETSQSLESLCAFFLKDRMRQLLFKKCLLHSRNLAQVYPWAVSVIFFFHACT